MLGSVERKAEGQLGEGDGEVWLHAVVSGGRSRARLDVDCGEGREEERERVVRRWVTERVRERRMGDGCGGDVGRERKKERERRV